MALRLGALYDALRQSPGIPESAAREAAEEVAGYENRLANIENRLTLLTWMIGTMLLLMIGLFWQTFAIMGRLPA